LIVLLVLDVLQAPWPGTCGKEISVTQTSEKAWTKRRGCADGPCYVEHESFRAGEALEQYHPDARIDEGYLRTHMSDEVTRDQARRMHHAAYRMSEDPEPRQRMYWKRKYLELRDRIVLGNRKLIYRAVRRWNPSAGYAEDLVGDCQIVLIQAVAAYNPWIGVRFSTYAFTCLMRALSRLTQKLAPDRLFRTLPLEMLGTSEPAANDPGEGSNPSRNPLEDFFQEGNTLLTFREKQVLVRRFQLGEQAQARTLEEIGRELGLSKERVRQVQIDALDKIRNALGVSADDSRS
jgi:RNA polymerase sigma factor (sigma-70 family)